MTRSVRQFFLLLSLMLLIASPRASAQGTIVISFDVPPDASFQIGAPVFFETRVINSSTDTVRVNMGHHGKWNYEFKIVGPDGKTFDVPPYRKFGPGPRGRLTAGPNQTVVKRGILDDWYVFKEPGEYILKVRLTVLLSSSANVSWQKEFFDDLKVVVAPLDEEKLHAACNNFAEQALHGETPSDRADALLALSYVTNPAAIPAQSRILQSGPKAMKAEAIRGLIKIGSTEAKEALRAALADADAEIKAQIESALAQFPSGS